MEWVAGLDFEKIANAIVILVAGLAAGLGFRTGKKALPAAAESTVTVAGALVDSAAVTKLTAAIEAATLEAITLRHEDEKLRKLGYELTDTIEKMATELHELRSEIRVLGDRLAMRR